jgi:hypothetical protein
MERKFQRREEEIIVTKICSKCKQELDECCFGVDNGTKDGKFYWCKQCLKEHKKQYRLNNKEKILVLKKKYYQDHKEKCNDYTKKYYQENKERLIAYCIEYGKEYKRKRRKEDPLYKLRHNVSNRISQQIKKNGQSSWDFLPYSVQELRNHLEAQFDENMSWENYGLYWSIDHIIPQSLFDIKELGDEAMLSCWSLKNLRPLESKENLLKRDKILEEFEELANELLN